MKILIALLIISFSTLSHSGVSDPTQKSDREALATRVATYSIESTKEMRFTILADLQKMAELDLTEKNDMDLVKNSIKTLLLIDKMDVPRSGVQNLSDSYGRYPEIYKKAAELIATEENKKLLNELMQFMASFYESGNG